MARIAGRQAAYAWLVGVASLAVVAGLVWLALPMTPVVAGWAQQTIQHVTQQGAPEAEPAEDPEPAGGTGTTPADTPSAPTPEPAEPPEVPASCAELFSAEVWAQLSEPGRVSLDESVRFPPADFAGLPEAMGAQMNVGCTWRGEDGEAVVTLAEVADDAAATAERVLTAADYDCSERADALACERQGRDGEDGENAELHVIRGGLWLAVVRTLPSPPVPQDMLVAHVWP
ncbi:hypothetical protein M4I32_07505 [Microbacterium sp. LRZ72]|uniref:hypothetical protein n=1 Tax=Microbacterium sp. LRZ72 TaxID=2942481 RepID=UPI0029A44026|nr:hypothetical protein [Microbacterium sp. LRZ72]MDX2376645.1 hypothetical protein [Microbacterium sp. LRZ72]